jgi:hypothetical protein
VVYPHDRKVVEVPMNNIARRTRRRGTRLAGAGLALIVAGSVAGCGGSDDSGGSGDEQQSSAESWASQVCTSVTDWKGAIDDARTTLSGTANLSANSIRDAFDSLASATGTFVSDLSDIGAPETDAGDEAEAQLSSLSDDLQQQQDVIESATEQSTASLQDLLSKVSTVTGAVSAMITDAGVAVDNIRQLDGAQELEDAFQSEQACMDLRASASPSS